MSSSASRWPSLLRTLVGGLLDDRGARVVVLVDPVPEAHQPDAVLLVLDLRHERRRRRRRCAGSARSISSTAWLAPPCSGPNSALMPAETDANRLACEEPTSRTVEVEQFCSWSACRTKQQVERARPWPGRPRRARPGSRRSSAGSSRRARGVVRVEERLADRLLVRVGRDRRQLGEQPDRRDLDLLGVERVEAVLVEGRQRATPPRTAPASGARRAGSRRRTACRSSCSSVCRRICSVELGQLGRRRQLAVDQQVADLEEASTVLGQLLDRVAAVAQDAGVAVDVGDRRGAGRGVDEAGVEGDVARSSSRSLEMSMPSLPSVAGTTGRSRVPSGNCRVT